MLSSSRLSSFFALHLFASFLALNSAEEMEEAEEEEDDLEEQADYGPEDGVDRENEDGELMVTSVEQGALLENENLQVRAQVRESFGGDESAVEEEQEEDRVLREGTEAMDVELHEGPQPIVEQNEVGDRPVDDFNGVGFLAKSYPVLFPFGVGDVTRAVDRRHEVTFNEAIKHYVKLFNARRGCYHFAPHHRFLHHIQDIDERHRIQSQASVFVKQNASDADMSVRDMMSLVSSRDRATEFYTMIKRMERYASNINGSSSYMFARKKELLALMEQEGSANVWFTLTLPNWLWKDLQAALGDPPDRLQGEDDSSYEDRRNNHYRKLFRDCPHIANECFVRKSVSFVVLLHIRDFVIYSWFCYLYIYIRSFVNIRGFVI